MEACCVSWEEYKDVAWKGRDGIGEAKVQMELNLARNAKNNKKGFNRYIGQNWKAKDCVSPFINEKAELFSSDMEKAEVLSPFPHCSLLESMNYCRKMLHWLNYHLLNKKIRNQ